MNTSFNKFYNVNHFIEWVEKQKRFSKKVSLDKMKYYCELFGNPQNKFKSIHVSGTNGKGSTIAFIKSILMEAGFNVATFTSPYITCFNERIAINNEFIKDEDLLLYANMIIEKYPIILEANYELPSFFEFITLLAFIYFSNSFIDFAIIEVGIGGLLDSTNVINSSISVITNIAYDHMNVLGNTLEEILKQKLGIARPNHPLIVGTKEKSLQNICNDYCKKNNSPLTLTALRAFEIKKSDIYQTEFLLEGFDEPLTIKLAGYHQVENAIVAISTIEALGNIYNSIKKILTSSIKKGLEKTKWAGRLEIINENPLIMVDGAHNIDGVTRVSNFIKKLNYHKKRVIVSISNDKMKKEMIEILDQTFDEIIFTKYHYSRSAEATELLSLSNHPNKKVIERLDDIINYIKNNPYDFNIFMGSLYFVCDAKNFFKK